MELWLAAAIGAAFITAVVVLVARLRARAARKDESNAGRGPQARSCPLCSSLLAPGERVSSKLYPGKADRIMHIFGCPHCWPASNSAPRICPVCRRELDPEGWVVARYFEKPDRKHVHVLGCTSCRVK